MDAPIRTPHAPPASRTAPGQPGFRVLATCGAFEPGFRGGGPVRSLAHIAETVPPDVDFTLVTRDRDLGDREPYPLLSGTWTTRRGARIFYLDTGRPGQWLRLWRQLRRVGFDLLYLNSLWAPVYTVVPVVAARLGLIHAARILIAPRGELSPGALALKHTKKRLFLAWWGPYLRRAGVVWHASTPREAADIRAVCPWARVEINQDQSSLPVEPEPARHVRQGPPRLVFVSRISAKKNLLLVLRTLPAVRGRVDFDIYGPLEDAGYWARCEELIRKMPGTVRVRYRGELTPTAVRETFGEYDAFVFPTLGENFGHVIAESLSASCPVICSDETPWTDLLEKGGGTVVRDLTPEALAGAIQRTVSMTPVERLRARQQAGAAYRSWYEQTHAHQINVIEQVRQALWPEDR